MIVDDIQTYLREHGEPDFRDFQHGIMPTVDKAQMLGVRTPVLRAYAKQLCKRPDVDEFLFVLPHATFDETNLHAFILSEGKDYEQTVERINAFLPFVDNWATCDQTSPKIFKKHKAELVKQIPVWLASSHVYTIRFGIEMLMSHFLDEAFKPEYLSWVTAIHSDEYYVNMMIAWYLATALAKQWGDAFPVIQTRALSPWVQNKTIQKAVESYRITPEQKELLKTYKLK